MLPQCGVFVDCCSCSMFALNAPAVGSALLVFYLCPCSFPKVDGFHIHYPWGMSRWKAQLHIYPNTTKVYPSHVLSCGPTNFNSMLSMTRQGPLRTSTLNILEQLHRRFQKGQQNATLRVRICNRQAILAMTLLCPASSPPQGSRLLVFSY